MIVEQRTYTLRPGTVAEYLELYEQEGLAVQREYLPCMVGYYSTDVGELNQVIHMWAYTNLDERFQCRAALFRDKRWQDAVKKMYTYIEHMENKILIPAPFSPEPREASK
jgi:hypothetical protein